MKLNKKILLTLGIATPLIAVGTLVACSPASNEVTTPADPTPSTDKTTPGNEAGAPDTGGGSNTGDKPVGGNLITGNTPSNGTDPKQPSTSRNPNRTGTRPGSGSETPPSGTGTESGGGDYEDPTIVPKLTLSYETKLQALDTSLNEANYAGKTLDGTGNTLAFMKYDDKKYDEIKSDVYDTLNDYTFRLAVRTNENRVGLNGNPIADKYIDEFGTGWILDFEKNPSESYPLTWYIGTNLHVVVKMNPFEKPTKREQFDILYYPHNYKPNDKQEFYKIKKYPKIFFSAQNFLSETIDTNPKSGTYAVSDYQYHGIKDYAKDFAVLKITFDDAEQAKKLTRNFANKYAQPKIKFNKTTILDEDAETLNKKNDIFVLGYPAISSTPLINQRVDSVSSKTASSLSKINSQYLITNGYDQILPGIADSMKIQADAKATIGFKDADWRGRTQSMPLSMWWHDRYYDRFGLSIVANQGDLGEGSSGSLVIDSKFNALGINWAKTDVGQGLIADTFNSPDLFTQDGKRVFYKYDLINGTENTSQARSFKGELKKELANKTGVTSWLFGSNLQ